MLLAKSKINFNSNNNNTPNTHNNNVTNKYR